MTAVLVTGMSGTGKSTVLAELARRGHRCVDTDTERWSCFVRDTAGELDWVWRLDRLTALLRRPGPEPLFVAGCKTNQGALHSLFDHVVVLTAPRAVVLGRVSNRPDNPWGATPESRAVISAQIDEVEPRLLAVADLVLDATRPVEALADRLSALARL